MTVMPKRLNRSESGIVSLMMTLVIMLVISLIVIGIAQLSRREQRQALDNQLSTQAFYAAESGINDAQAKLTSILNSGAGATIPAKTTCGDQAPYSFANGVISATDNIAYTCLLIDPHPPQMTVSLGPSAQVLPVEAADGSLGSLTLQWTKPRGITTSVSNCTAANFPATGSWNCPYGVLRVDLVNVGNGTNLNRTSLAGNTMTLFVAPRNGGGAASTSYSAAAQPNRYTASCNASTCNFTVNGLGSSKYYLRATEIYQTGGNLVLTSTGNTFANGQVVVDATGKAQDVLRRIRVALDIAGENQNRTVTAPLISGQTICKQFWAYSGFQQAGPDGCTE